MKKKQRTTMKAMGMFSIVLLLAGCGGAGGGRSAVRPSDGEVFSAALSETGERTGTAAGLEDIVRTAVPRQGHALAARAGKVLASVDVTPEAGGVIEYGAVRLEVPAGVVKEAVEIKIEELERPEALDAGMKNVTGGAAGYRFLPDGMRFLKPVTLRMAYDRTAVHTAVEYENLHTYYYNTRIGKWEKLKRMEVDEQAGMIVSLTDHFTDMVNSTLTLPETPKTLSFNPTSVKDVKGGDPGMGIQLIEAPTGNREGSASLKFEIEAPAGRRGMGPQLAVRYNSDGGNGWLGLGWNLGVSSVRVDTRWGVPRYNAAKETETYALDGEMLLPAAHRTAYNDLPAREGEHKRFWSRVEGAFQKIIRHGTGPENYWWEVTAKNGMQRFYGGTPEEGCVADAVLGNGNGISQWNLVEERDTYGNYVRYEYASVTDSGTGNGSGGVPGRQVYLKEVRWTGNRGAGLSPTHRIVLIRDREQDGWPGTRRGDVSIDCRGGFKTVTADLLKKVEVYEGTRLIRGYVFDYVTGPFGKSLLSVLARSGNDDTEFYQHTFAYYKEDGYCGFGPEEDASPGMDNVELFDLRPLAVMDSTVLGTSTGWNAGGNVYLGVGWNVAEQTKSSSAGLRGGYNRNESEPKTVFMDITGDGVLDKVFAKGSLVSYRPGVLDADGRLGFAGESVPLDTVNKLGLDTTDSYSIGGEVNINPIYVSAVYTATHTNGEVYWTDVNGDGLPDWVNHGVVYFCYLDGGTPRFSTNSQDTGVPVGAGGDLIVSDSLREQLHAEYEKVVAASPPMDAVRVWTAPYNGTVRISGHVRLDDRRTGYMKNGKEITRSQYEGVEGKTDGVRVSIQKNGNAPLWMQTIGPLDHGEYVPEGVDAISMAAGDQLFLRVNSIWDGLFDEVGWTPEIEYTVVDGTAVENLETTRDANGLESYRYSAARDDAYAGRSGELFPGYDTTAVIGGVLRKGRTSADVTVRVYKIEIATDENGQVIIDDDTGQIETEYEQVFERSLAWNEEIPAVEFINQPIALKSTDGLSFTMSYDSPVDLGSVVWAPTVTIDHYNTAEYGTQVLTPPVVMHGYANPPVYVPVSDRLRVWTAGKDAGEDWIIVDGDPEHSDSTVRLWPTVSMTGTGGPIENPPAVTGRVRFTVKRADRVEPVTSGVITISGNTRDGFTQPIALTISDVVELDKYFLEFHIEELHVPAGANPVVYSIRYRFGSDPEQTIVGYDENNQPIYKDFFRTTGSFNRDRLVPEGLIPASYRGWGVFAYNGSVTGEFNFENPPPLRQLHPNHLQLDEGYAGNVNHDTGAGAKEPDAYIMYPDPVEGQWKSADEECLIARYPGSDADDPADDEHVMSSSRKNDNHPEEIEIAVGGGGASLVNRRSWAFQGAVGGGVELPVDVGGQPDDIPVSLGGTVSAGNSYGVVEYIDFNGDRYPDFLTDKTIQYTAANGGLIGQTKNIVETRLNTNYSGTLSVGPDFTITAPDSKNKGVVYVKSVKAGGNFGGALSICFNDFIDMNGDGLPDLVSGTFDNPSISVSLNTGYGFAAPESWGSGYIRSNGSISSGLNANLNLGFDVDFASFSGGVSLGRTGTGVFETLLDMNGDGLPDHVRRLVDGTLLVALNTGSGFAAVETAWTGGYTDRWINQGGSASGGASASITISIPIPIAGIRIVISGGGNAGINAGWNDTDLRDVNADGCPDWVVSTNDHELKVRYNRRGRTNLLRRVEGPLGSSLEIEYERTRPSQAMPQSKWVMSGVRTEDGHSGDGVDTRYVTYAYANGKYDRYEREGYGFGAVTSRLWKLDQSVLLTTISTYATDNYFRKALLLDQSTYDGDGTLLSRQTNEYETVDVAEAVPGVRYTRPVRTQHEEYEPGSYDGMVTAEEYRAYDRYGNVTEYLNAGSVTEWEDDVQLSISYDDDETKINNHLLSLPDEVVVRDYAGHVLRRRMGTYNDHGDLASYRVYDGTNWLETRLTYNAGTGNTETVTDPTGFRLTYGYDPDTQSLVAGVTDSFGCESETTYDPGLGVPLVSTDTNGNVIRYEYDGNGRLVRVFGPYGGTTPALEFAYYHTERPARAVTRNKVQFDPENPETLVTVVFTDGWDRLIQTKKQTEIWDADNRVVIPGMSISGLVEYDEFGRAVRQSQPAFRSGDDYTFTATPRKNATETEYDARGRAVHIAYPDLSEVRTEFRIRNGLRETAVTDPEGRTKIRYADAVGNIVRVVQTRNGVEVSTAYSYNTLHEITQVLDADGNPIIIEYDLLGRRTSMTTPDAGTTEYRYDGAGRLYRKIDASLREKGKWIEYGYEYARLKTITYPDTGAGGTVTYTYGTNGNRDINAAGRLLAVENKMSLIRYEYGKLGETVKTTKTLKLLRGINESYTGVMEYGYDYLGRVQSVTYPDGEVLRYGYGRGGEVKTVTGARDGLTARYVKLIAYDEFGQRAFLRYGNDVTTQYSYHPTRRWLERIRTVSASGRVFQDMTYTFDRVGNIMRTANTAGEKTITQEYNYDDLDQLVSARGNYSDRSLGGETVHGYTQRFAYDIIGNMVKKTSTHTLQPGRSRTDLNYTLDYAYEKARPHCAVTIGDSSYEYDSNGNVTEEIYAKTAVRVRSERGALGGPNRDDDEDRGHITVGPEDWAEDEPEPGTVLRSFIWDEENRMTEAVAGNEHVYFAYDAAGERTLKYSEHGETVYVDRMYQVETNQAPKLYTKHIFVGETRLISRVGGEGQAYGGQDGEIYYYHADHLGNTTWVTDNHGAEYEHIEYCPYGESWVNEGRDALNRINHLFTSKELDAETGLYYFGARYLDPKTSRWLSTDPAMEEYLPAAGKGSDGLPGMGGVYNTVNLVTYHYGANNPLKYVDPNGLNPVGAGEGVVELKPIIPRTDNPLISSVSKNNLSYKFDMKTLEVLASLHPKMYKKVLMFILLVNAEGIDIRLTQGLRSLRIQEEYYKIGRDDQGNITDKPRKHVTDAKPGYSYHNYGLAIDIYIEKDGKRIWDTRGDIWKKVGAIGESLGFRWGAKFPKLYDPAHFEYSFGYSESELKKMYEGGYIENGYVILKRNMFGKSGFCYFNVLN